MRIFLILTFILFFELNVYSQVQDKLDQYFDSENYALYISHFEDKYLLEDLDNINSNHVSNYIISLLKSNFNSSGIVPSRKLKNLKNNIENYILSNKSNTTDRLLYEYGKSEFNSDRFNSSVKYLRKITFKNDEIYFLLGVAEYNIKNYKNSKDYLELVDSEKYFEKKNFFLGVISYLENDLGSALNYFNNISNSDLENKYLQYLVSINFINNNYKETISLKNRINENVDNIDYCLFFIGKSHFILKEFKNSIDVLTQLGSKVDRDDEISFMIAYSHYMNKDYNLSKELLVLKESIGENADGDGNVGPTGSGRKFRSPLDPIKNSIFFDRTDDHILCGVIGDLPADGTVKPYNQVTVASWAHSDPVTGLWGVGAPDQFQIASVSMNGGWRFYAYNKRIILVVNTSKTDGTKQTNTLQTKFNQLAQGKPLAHTSGPLSGSGWHYLVGTYDGRYMKYNCDLFLIANFSWSLVAYIVDRLE